jgi:hypothetical protein
MPDERERFDLLERAIAVARETPAVVERADLARWVAERLAAPRLEMATVVFHTIVWPTCPTRSAKPQRPRSRPPDSAPRPRPLWRCCPSRAPRPTQRKSS